MNEHLDFIFARRSVRSFTDEQVSDEQVRGLLEAGMSGPSAMAKDPWHFIVVKDGSVMNEMFKYMPKTLAMSHGPLAIVVCGDMSRAHNGLESFVLQDCSAATENILLAAVGLGLGGCWLGIHPHADRMKALAAHMGLAAHIVPVAAAVIGMPVEQPPARTRYREDAVHVDRW